MVDAVDAEEPRGRFDAGTRSRHAYELPVRKDLRSYIL